MNVAVVNLEGKSPRYSTFDLYGHDSTDLKAFLNLLQPGEVIFDKTIEVGLLIRSSNNLI